MDCKPKLNSAVPSNSNAPNLSGDPWRQGDARTLASMYLAQGWAPVPCCWPQEHGTCGCGLKHEGAAVGKALLLEAGEGEKDFLKNWSPSQEQVSSWFSVAPRLNVGIALEPSHLIDVDCDGQEAIEEAMRRGLPRTVMFRRGQHGLHALYRRPGNVTARRAVGVWRSKEGSDHIDILAAGHVVVPPSRHREGQQYEWVISPAEAELAEPPAWVTKALEGRSSSNGSAAVVVPATPLGPRRDCPGWVLSVLLDEHCRGYGGDRSAALWAVIKKLVWCNWSNEEIKDLLRAYPWTRRVDKHRDTERYWDEEIARARTEVALARERQGTQADLEEEENTEDFVPVCRLDDHPGRWVIEGLVPIGGLTILAGRPKVGKSTLARQMAAAIALGQDFFLGKRVVEPGRVLYYVGFGEGRKAAFREDMMRRGVTDQVLVSFGTISVERLRERVAALQPVAVFVDTVGKILVGADFDSYSAMANALRPLANLARSEHVAVVAIHHERKPGMLANDDDPTADVLGSTQIVASTETLLRLRRRRGGHPERKTFFLDVVGREVAEESLILARVHDDIAFTSLGPAERVEREEIVSELISLAKEAGTLGFALRDALERVDAPERTLRHVLATLVADGRLSRRGCLKSTRYYLPLSIEVRTRSTNKPAK